jgi:hypothetical protein
MEYDLVKLKTKDADSDFIDFLVLAPAGHQDVLQYYEVLLNDDIIFNDAREQLYEYGRIRLSQEQVDVLDLKIGVVI